MPLIPTHEWTPGQFDADTTDQIYNGLDTMVTLEVLGELTSLTNAPPEIYNFERALQAPAMDMMLRGFLVDQYARAEGAAKLRSEIAQLEHNLNLMAYAVWGKPLNPRSPLQLQQFFYGAMRLPEQWTSKKGVKKLSTDRETLEKLEQFFHAMPVVATILAIRERTKLLEVLDTEIDPDGRFRASYNIAGTETGRWSSSSNAFGTGRNAQNITADLRHIFIADPGWKLCGIDLEQAESREVGWQCGVLFDDWSYLDACYSGDLHTTVCRMTWTELPWTGDKAADRKIAEQPFYRHYTYRDMAKKLGHGCVPADHQVLTDEGWVSIAEMPKRIMAWDPNIGQHMVDVEHWTEFDNTARGPGYHLAGGCSRGAINLVATAGHRVPLMSLGKSNFLDESTMAGLYRLRNTNVYSGLGVPCGNGDIVPLSALSIRSIELNTQVYCPTVPSSWFMVRHKRRVFVTGNSNYYGQPFTMARHAKIPVDFARHFQERYFAAFPGIPRWHRWTAEQLQRTAKITTPWGRTRTFFGRQGDDATLREAIAYCPQSSTGDRLNLALWRVWRTMGSRIRLMAQVHDALYFQYRESDNEADVIATALGLIETPMEHSGHRLVVPGEAKIGWNWGNMVTQADYDKWVAGGSKGQAPRINPEGLTKFKPSSPDMRVRRTGWDRIAA